jgi:hypothetical protein
MIYTPEFLGLPQEVIDIAKNRVMRNERQRTVKFYTKNTPQYAFDRAGRRYITGFKRETLPYLTTTQRNNNAYALNWLHSKVHEDGYEYSGQDEQGRHIFFRDEVEFWLPNFVLTAERAARINDQSPFERDQYTPHPDGGYICYQHPSAFFVTEQNDEVIVEWLNDPEQYNYIGTVNGRRQTIVVSDDVVAETLGMTIEQLNEEVKTTWHGVNVSAGQIANAFVVVDSNVNGTIEPSIYVNGTLTAPSQYGNFTTMQGTRTSLRLNAVVYNDCTAETADASAGFEAGNFGACSIVKGITSFPFAVEFDPTKEHAVVEFRFCEQPETGKEWRWHGYFNLKTGEQIPALIRKPHPDAIFF